MRARILAFMFLTATTAAVSGCGSGPSSGPAITVQAARRYQVTHFTPARPIAAHVPTPVSFTIDQPSGRPLTSYRTGSGPHTGVHLIIVRTDLGVLIHRHPPVGAAGEKRGAGP